MRSAKTALCELLFASTCLSLQYLGILHHGMEGAIKFSFLFLQDLKDYMRQAGEVTFTQCHRDRIGEGLVELVLIWISLLVVVVVKFAVKEDLTSNTVLVQKPCGFFLQFCWQSKWIIFFFSELWNLPRLMTCKERWNAWMELSYWESVCDWQRFVFSQTCNVILFSSVENNVNVPYLEIHPVQQALVMCNKDIFSHTTFLFASSSLSPWNKY